MSSVIRRNATIKAGSVLNQSVLVGGVPVTITGINQVRQTLTAVPAAGYTNLTYQWKSDGTNISGATSSTYGVSYTTAGTTITCDVGGTYTPTAGVASSAAPAAPTITGVTAGNGSVTTTFTRAADNGGDTVTGDRLYVYQASDDTLVGQANGTSPITLSGIVNGVAVYTKAATIGSLNGVGAQSAASATVTPDNAVSPAFTVAPAISAAVVGSLATYTQGTVTGTPTPTVVDELMVFGRPQPISTVLSTLHRSTLDTTSPNINIRETATNSSGVAVRMASPGQRCAVSTADPRWTQHPYMKAVPQVGRPVGCGGLTGGGTAGFSYVLKGCVSNTAIVEGDIDAATFTAATAGAGSMSATNSTGTYTPVSAEAGKFVYFVMSMTNSQGTIYWRTKSEQVRAAGVATGKYRFATAGGNRLATAFYTNNTGVTMEAFMFVDVTIASANRGNLKVVFANRGIPDTSINADIATGNAFTMTSARLCPPGVSQSGCPQILIGGSLGTIADGAYDVVSDAMAPGGFNGKTEHMVGDKLAVKIKIIIPNGAKLPYVSGGDLTTGNQCWLYNPSNTTITNFDTGITAGFTGTAPDTVSLGDGIPFDIIGLQVTGDAQTDLSVSDSIYANPQGRSPFAVSHYLCDGFGWSTIAAGHGGRVGATTALFNNSAYLQSRVKYASRVILEMNTNSAGGSNLGGISDLQALDTTVVANIRANAASPVAGLSALTVVRVPLLFGFAMTNADSSNFSTASPATQTPLQRYGLGGEIYTYNQWCAGLGAGLFDAYIDYSPAMRLGTDPASIDYYKVQPGTMSFEAGASAQVHPNVLGGFHLGLYMRELIAALPNA